MICPQCSKGVVAKGRKWCDDCVARAVRGEHSGMHITIDQIQSAQYEAQKKGFDGGREWHKRFRWKVKR